jgi:hypothetical protein
MCKIGAIILHIQDSNEIHVSKAKKFLCGRRIDCIFASAFVSRKDSCELTNWVEQNYPATPYVTMKIPNLFFSSLT